MPPNHNRSVGLLRSARISSLGVRLAASTPINLRISSLSVIDLELRGKTPPPLDILALS